MKGALALVITVRVFTSFFAAVFPDVDVHATQQVVVRMVIGRVNSSECSQLPAPTLQRELNTIPP